MMSSISNHVPMRRHIRAFCSTSRIVRDKDFAKWESEPWTQMWLPFLAIEHFPALLLDELWVIFGVCTHFRQIAIHRLLKISMKKQRCSSMRSMGATMCLLPLLRENVSMVSVELLSIRNRCLPPPISPACRREL